MSAAAYQPQRGSRSAVKRTGRNLRVGTGRVSRRAPQYRAAALQAGMAAKVAALNSEYDDAKNEQAMLESRIAQLEAALRLAKDALADIGVDDVLIAIDAALGEERT
jgi:hypothetical protein